MATLHEAPRIGEWIIAEENNSRDDITVARSLYDLPSGSVLGVANTDAVAVTPDLGNAGNGDFAVPPVPQDDVYPGNYQLEITAAEFAPIVVSAAPDIGNAGNATIAAPDADVMTAQTGIYTVEITAAITPEAVSSAVPDGANIGDGDIGVVTTAAGVQGGIYTIEITAEAPNAGTFSVTDPSLVLVDNGTVGVAFNNEIAFTLADGPEDFDVGDKFYVVVDNALPAEFTVEDPSGAVVGTGVEGTEFNTEIRFTVTPGVVDSGVGDTFAVEITAGSPATFDLTRHDGTAVLSGLRGTAYTTELGFTLNEGVVPWAVGDILAITVGAGAGVYKHLLQGITADGSDAAVAILLDSRLRADGTYAGVAMTRKAVLAAEELPVVTAYDLTDPTDPVVVALRAAGILLRATL